MKCANAISHKQVFQLQLTEPMSVCRGKPEPYSGIVLNHFWGRIVELYWSDMSHSASLLEDCLLECRMLLWVFSKDI